MSTQRILLPIDVVLDTRLATVELINEAAAVDMLENGYRHRQLDDYTVLTKGQVSNEVFMERFERRDIDTLKKARLSGIGPVLSQIANSLEIQGQQDPNITEIVVELNCWPYKLDQATKDAFITCIGAFTSLSTQVVVVEIPFEQLTPKLFKENYSAVFIYEFNRWQLMFSKQFMETRLPDVTILAPAIFHTKVPTEKELADERGEPINPWAATEAMYVEFFSLVLCDVSLFSVVEA